MFDGWPEGVRPRTDLGNAERVADAHGADVRYAVDRALWLYWSETHWKRGHEDRIARYAASVARSISKEALLFPDVRPRDPDTHVLLKSDRAIHTAFAMRSEGRSALESMIALSRYHERIGCYGADFDADPWLFCTPTAVVNLREGSVAGHERTQMLSRCSKAGIDSMVDTPVFTAFLDQIFLGSADLIAFVQRALGMSLIGMQREHVIFFCFGDGGNGKGTLLNLMLRMLGDYGVKLPANMLIEQNNPSHPTELTDLEGARIAIGGEVPKGAAWDENKIKDLSGADPIRAHKMRMDFYQFEASHTLWVQGNDKPRIRGTNKGIWRRMRMIPFCADIQTEDKDLPAKLDAEAAGIMAWIIEGCRLYMQDGLGTCQEVADATAEYKRTEDFFGTFLDECCECSPEATCSKEEFRKALTAWLETSGFHKMTDRAIKADIERRGIVEHRTNRLAAWQWKGVRVVVSDVSPPRRDWRDDPRGKYAE